MPDEPVINQPCAACRLRGKTWDGGDPCCAFDGRPFIDNWNCATLNAIRDIVGPANWNIEREPEVDFRHHEDQSYATIFLDAFEDRDINASTLWISWYKSRGRTEAIWLLNEAAPPRRPTERECLNIIKHFLGREIADIDHEDILKTAIGLLKEEPVLLTQLRATNV